jgi:hypothetical protein
LFAVAVGCFVDAVVVFVSAFTFGVTATFVDVTLYGVAAVANISNRKLEKVITLETKFKHKKYKKYVLLSD